MPQFESRLREPAQPTASSEPFACEFRAEGLGAAWVSARGELDLARASEFERTLQEALEGALLVIVDLRELTFIDSTGLHAIVAADWRARQTGHCLVLIRGPGQVHRLFEIVGLTHRLKIVDLAPDPTTDARCAGSPATTGQRRT